MPRRKQNISITKMAKEAGTSPMTVSRVLNNRDGVSEETRERILAIQNKYHYKSKYAPARKEKLAIVTSSSGLDDYQRRIMQGIVKFDDALRFDISIALNAANSDLLANIRGAQCAGLVIPTGNVNSLDLLDLRAFKMPVALLDAKSDYASIASIDNDSYGGSLRLTRLLLEFGHRKIAYMRYGKNDNGNQDDRLKGCIDALRLAGLKPAITIAVNELEAETGLSFWDNTPLTVKRILERAPDITAIMCADDILALRAMHALGDLGKRIPDDISVVGFDNHSESSFWNPALTTVDHPLEEEGRLAVEAIAHAIDHPGAWLLPNVVLPTKLIVRESLKRIEGAGK